MKKTLITLAMTILSTVVFSQNYGYQTQCTSIEILNYTHNVKVVKVIAIQPGFQKVIAFFNLSGKTKQNIDVSQWELGTSFQALAGQYYMGQLELEGLGSPTKISPCSYSIGN